MNLYELYAVVREKIRCYRGLYGYDEIDGLLWAHGRHGPTTDDRVVDLMCREPGRQTLLCATLSALPM
ncbi:uncharacterized protein BJX67DRAFT_200415 [Aspergillus lucknowensis]|uniref:Uncharacterized protein n=1 Tax=Aspergillus lucknowensis TaxID=176173 RepID=A0ABR4LN57_9EURO